MIINFRKNLRLIALFLAVCTASNTLAADSVPSAKEAPVSLTTLKASRKQLKSLSRDVKDPDMLMHIQAALKTSSAVIRAGVNATPQHAKKAFGAVQKLLAKLDQNEALHASHIHTSSSSSSSNSSCDVCGDIGHIQDGVKTCCQAIKTELAQIITFVETSFPCSNDMAINQVPVIISQPGKYCVTTNLLYTGPNAAITVTADNVSINFQNHSLTLNDSAAQGIVVQNVSEFTLENDIIQGANIFTTATSAGVVLNNVNKATLNNIYTKNTSRGVSVVDSNDVKLVYSHLESHEGTVQITFPSPASLAGLGDGGALWIDGSSGVTADSCTFTGADLEFDASRTAFGVHIEGNSSNVTLSNNTFSNWLGSIHALNVDGLLVDHCIAIASPVSTLSLVQLGGCDSTERANDVIIQNSNFTQMTANPAFDGILLYGGTGCVLDNVLVDTMSTDIQNGYQPAAVHVGNTTCPAYTNVKMVDCLFKGSNGRTVYIENGEKVIVDGCQISGANTVNVHLVNATNCVVKNSSISSGNNGILINNTLAGGNNSIENCLVYNNTITGISVVDQKNNHLSGNSVWGSNNGIQLTFPGFTETYYNTSCNNSVHNCTNVIPSQIPGASPSVAGGNVCCNPQ